ncbi:hypothetical protein BD311DRAFT_105814 [Dichomitus squalens]|uniref:Uncharacterized protein n=1 Tax=Dichomitus squalens TaxID=114155 RepID=A0A4Q9MA86_9APHY|nr:hypothetical protein BD311DRAFT_105814 [Dichomitus squalens]
MCIAIVVLISRTLTIYIILLFLRYRIIRMRSRTDMRPVLFKLFLTLRNLNDTGTSHSTRKAITRGHTDQEHMRLDGM